MIKIGLCDDISVQLSIIYDIVEKYCKDHNLEAKIREFESGEALLDYVNENGFFDIYFLDMILPGVQGIEIGQRLRAMGDNGKIVYLTATSEYAVESYEVKAFFYLLKPISKDSIFKVLDKAIEDIEDSAELEDKADKNIEIKTHNGKQIIRIKDILYVDIVNRGLCYHMIDGKTLEGPMLRIPFSEAVSNLISNDNIVFAGSHLLVNSANVEKADRTSVTFKNDEQLFLSKNAGNALYERLKYK